MFPNYIYNYDFNNGIWRTVNGHGFSFWCLLWSVYKKLHLVIEFGSVDLKLWLWQKKSPTMFFSTRTEPWAFFRYIYHIAGGWLMFLNTSRSVCSCVVFPFMWQYAFRTAPLTILSLWYDGSKKGLICSSAYSWSSVRLWCLSVKILGFLSERKRATQSMGIQLIWYLT